jgi:hypothetical protein
VQFTRVLSLRRRFVVASSARRSRCFVRAEIPLLLLGTLLLAAANPPLDAARLDVIPAWLWGRAEAVRSGLRSLGESVAPVTFGFISTGVFRGADGLTDTFLGCLVPRQPGSRPGFLNGRRRSVSRLCGGRGSRASPSSPGP